MLDTQVLPLDGASVPRALPISAPSHFIVGSSLTLQVDQLPAVLVQSAGGDTGRSIEAGWQPERNRIINYLSHYPNLTGWQFLTPEGQPTGLQRSSQSRATLPILVHLPEGRHPVAEVAARTFPYANQQLTFPTVGGSDLPAHPFLVWFALTYGLSMLARYEPTAWVARTAINRSRDAAPLEHLLEQALRILPGLIYTTILRASEPSLSTG